MDGQKDDKLEAARKFIDRATELQRKARDIERQIDDALAAGEMALGLMPDCISTGEARSKRLSDLVN